MNTHITRKEKELIVTAKAKTEMALEQALNGDIPGAALSAIELDKTMVSEMIAKELLLLHYAAEGAKMGLIALLLFELHVALLRKEKSVKVQNTV
jgi:hypothetical protein